MIPLRDSVRSRTAPVVVYSIIAACVGVTVRWREAEELPEAWEDLGRHDNDLVVSSQALRDALGFSEVTTSDGRIADLVGWLRSAS